MLSPISWTVGGLLTFNFDVTLWWFTGEILPILILKSFMIHTNSHTVLTLRKMTTILTTNHFGGIFWQKVMVDLILYGYWNIKDRIVYVRIQVVLRVSSYDYRRDKHYRGLTFDRFMGSCYVTLFKALKVGYLIIYRFWFNNCWHTLLYPLSILVFELSLSVIRLFLLLTH